MVLLRRAVQFSTCVVVAASLAAGRIARADDAPAALLRVGSPARAPSSPSEPWETVWICPRVRAPRACDERIGVPLGHEPVRIRDLRLETPAERRPARALARWGWLVGDRDRVLSEGRAPTSSGAEPAPPMQLHVQRELLELLADLTGERALRHATIELPDRERSRGARVEDAVLAQSRRATYVEVERLRGTLRTTVSPARSLAAGGSLAIGALVLDAFFPNPRPEEAGVTPAAQVWAPGIRIKGRFSIP